MVSLSTRMRSSMYRKHWETSEVCSQWRWMLLDVGFCWKNSTQRQIWGEIVGEVFKSA